MTFSRTCLRHYVVLPGVGGEGRGGKEVEGDKGSVAESERGRGVLYEYVPVNSGASVIYIPVTIGME